MNNNPSADFIPHTHCALCEKPIDYYTSFAASMALDNADNYYIICEECYNKYKNG